MPARALVPLVLLCGLLALASPATASVVTGPRLAFVEWLAEPPMTRLATVSANGSARLTLPLAGVQPVPFEGPAFTADGSTLVFAGYLVDLDGERREAGSELFVVDSEGGVPRPIPGTGGGSHPVLSPDGRTVAFKRSKLIHRFDPHKPLDFGTYFSVTTWILSLEGGRPRRLTPWRDGLVSEPAAFSPDGATLLLERDKGPGWNPEVIAFDLAGGGNRVLARRAEDPAFSPDGTRIALVSYRDGLGVRTVDGRASVGELYLIAADGSQSRRLTRTKAAQESQPSWSPDGQRIAFLRARGPGGLGSGSRLMQMNADGGCARRVTGSEGRRAPALFGPVWQPGPGRETPALAC